MVLIAPDSHLLRDRDQDEYANAVGGGCTDMSLCQRDIGTHHTINSGLPLTMKDVEANCYLREQLMMATQCDGLNDPELTTHHNAHYNEEQDREEVSNLRYIARAAFHGQPCLLYPDDAEQVHKSGTIDEDKAFYCSLLRSPFSITSVIAEAPSHASSDTASFDVCIMTDDELCGLFDTARCNADVPFPRTAYLLHQRCTSERRPYLKIFTKEFAAESDTICDDTNATKMGVNKKCTPSFNVASWKEQIVAFRSFESLFVGSKHDSASRVL